MLGTVFKYYVTEEAQNFAHFRLSAQQAEHLPGPRIMAYFEDYYGLPKERITFEIHKFKYVKEPLTW